jgi:hypothetical protein
MLIGFEGIDKLLEEVAGVTVSAASVCGILNPIA